MALQDLTPQLRTRLSRVERLVGLFITTATLLLFFGLGYYVYQIAERKGWFLTKMPYFTFVRDAAGLNVGDRIKLMGFDVGEIMEIKAMPPDDPWFNVYIRFRINEPDYGYLWEDSRAKIGSSDFLGHRVIEVTKGTNGAPTYPMREVKEVSVPQAMSLVGGTNNVIFSQRVVAGTNVLAHVGDLLTKEALDKAAAAGLAKIQVIDYNTPPVKKPEWIWDEKKGMYRRILTDQDKKGYWIQANESPALAERLETVINKVEAALPDFLALTNKIAGVLTNASALAVHADDLLVNLKPTVTNFAQISANLKNPKGALGDWLIPTNINTGLQDTLHTANATAVTAQTNIAALSAGLLASLENVAQLTSNLNAQVQANGLILGQISDLIVHSDEMIQGLKRFWLLRSAFGPATNAPVQSLVKPTLGGAK
jgi:hypothetical protein